MQGKIYPRASTEYQLLLDRAYLALFKNQGFKAALRAAKDAVFTHSVGKNKIGQTVLTTQEFCHRLNWLRELLKKEDTQVF